MKLKHKTVKWIIGIIVTVLALLGLIFAVPGLYKGAVYLLRLFMPFVLGYIFALLVNPLVKRLEDKLKLPRKASALIVIILLIGVAGGLVSWVIYKIVDEIRTIYSQIPAIYKSVVAELDIIKVRFEGIYEILPANIQSSISDIAQRFSEIAAEFIDTKSVPLVTGAGSVAKSLPKVFVSVVIFLLSSFFIICDFDRVKGYVKRLFRIKNTDKLSRVMTEIKKYFGAYVKAQGTIMFIAFCILFLGFGILNVQYALIIAIATAVLDALPFFGSGAVLWPWALISFITGDIKMGVGAILIYVVIVVTRQFIEPKIVSKNIGVSPILTLISMYLGFKIFSIGGMIFGPLVMMLLISLYRAGVFETPMAIIRSICAKIGRQLKNIKQKCIDFWESE